MRNPANKVIRASEVGQYAYCARAWWLGRVLGYEPQNVAELAAGLEEHEEHGRQVVSYHRLQRAAYALFLLALFIGVLLLWLASRVLAQ